MMIGLTSQPNQLGVVPPANQLSTTGVCGEDKAACEKEKMFYENFSKSLLLDKLTQYYAGKYTRRYIDAYLEFCHLSGYLSNLDYLDIKENMSKDQS
jgi:hypothetical protein